MTAVTFFRPVAHAESGLRPLLALLRPILLLAVLAFFAGFGGYLILGPPQVLSGVYPTQVSAPAVAAPTPAVQDDAPAWDTPKQA